MMMQHKPGFEKLIAWRKAMDLVAFVYDLVKAFPDSEKSGLSAGLKKAVAGIPGKIAAASESTDLQASIKSLDAAQAMLVDLFNQALIAHRVKAMKRRPLARLRQRCEKLDALIERDAVALAKAIDEQEDARREAEEAAAVEAAAREAAAHAARPKRVIRVRKVRRPDAA